MRLERFPRATALLGMVGLAPGIAWAATTTEVQERLADGAADVTFSVLATVSVATSVTGAEAVTEVVLPPAAQIPFQQYLTRRARLTPRHCHRPRKRAIGTEHTAQPTRNCGRPSDRGLSAAIRARLSPLCGRRHRRARPGRLEDRGRDYARSGHARRDQRRSRGGDVGRRRQGSHGTQALGAPRRRRDGQHRRGRRDARSGHRHRCRFGHRRDGAVLRGEPRPTRGRRAVARTRRRRQRSQTASARRRWASPCWRTISRGTATTSPPVTSRSSACSRTPAGPSERCNYAAVGADNVQAKTVEVPEWQIGRHVRLWRTGDLQQTRS